MAVDSQSYANGNSVIMTATTYHSREVFIHASDAMLVIDPYKDRLLMANIAACRLLGYAEQELLDKRASSLCGRLIPALVVFTQEVCEKGTGWRDDIPLQNKQGQRLEVEIAAAAFSEAGQTLLIFTVRDVEKSAVGGSSMKPTAFTGAASPSGKP